MKLKTLTLHNFGIYSGTTIINFENSKPVVLIGGMNGHGKTTILEAILLSLYGRRSFAFTESKLSFPNYLSKYVNQGDGTNQTQLELEFILNHSTQEYSTIRVSRSWNLKKASPSIETIVFKDDKFDEYLSANWDMFVETILPAALASLFFFDGEKIAELANTDSDESIKKSIRSLLGIDVIDQAIADTQKIIANKGKQIKHNEHLKTITALEKEISIAEKQVKTAMEAHGKVDAQLKQAQAKLQKAENLFLASGGKAVASRTELLERKALLEHELELSTAELLDFSSGDTPLLLVMPLLQRIQLQAQQERDQKGLEIALEQLPSLYKTFSNSERVPEDFDRFISFIKTTNSTTPSVYNLSEQSYFKLLNLCEMLPKYHTHELQKILDKRVELSAHLKEIEDRLSVQIDEKAINSTYQEILSLTAKVAGLNEHYEQTLEELGVASAKYEELKKARVRVIEKAVGVMEDSDDIKRIVTYCGRVINVLQEYRRRLQEEKAAYLAETMTKCFKSIVSKQHLIDRIDIEAETLNFTFYNGNGALISRAALSAGEKQLLIIAMLWAIAICSKKEFPVIVDTPLARLDSAHRETLIKNYFARASKQMILLSTDSEVYGPYYDMINPFVDHEITLAYDEVAQKSYVIPGYFGGDTK